MATKQQLESALRNADKSGDLASAKRLANAIKAGQFDTVKPESKKNIEGVFNKFKERQSYGGAGNILLEAASGINRGASGIADFFISKPFNAASNLVGSDVRMPLASESFEGANTGNFMDDGALKDVVRKGSEVIPEAMLGGGALRYAAGQLPALASGAESVGAGLLRQMGSGTAAGDVVYGAASGAGGEIGADTAELLLGERARPLGEGMGAIVGPVAFSAMSKPVVDAAKFGAGGIKRFFKNAPKDLTDEGMVKFLTKAMQNEGLSPKQVGEKISSLGSEGIAADVGENFSALLRTSANQVPRIRGESNQVLNARQAGSGGRINRAVDESTDTKGLTLDQEITRLDDQMNPVINQLYSEAGESGINISPRLKSWMENKKDSVGKAVTKAQSELTDRRSLGDRITNIDVIDSTKRVLDDQIQSAIRGGERNRASILTRKKNEMVAEADRSIPVYKEARNMYAGKMALKSASDYGQMFLKIKPDDMRMMTKSYSEGEKRMFRLGAKQAIVDKINDTKTTADIANRMFSKGGDVNKLKYLFDDQANYKNFEQALKRESDFSQTRRAIQGNSTTYRQGEDAKNYMDLFTDVARATSNPRDATSLVGKIINGFSKSKGSDEFNKSMEAAGYMLLQKGMDTKALVKLLKTQNEKEIAIRLRSAMKKPISKKWAGAVSGSALMGDE